MTDDRLPYPEVDKIVRIDDNEVEFKYTFLMEEEWKGKWATSELRMFIVQKRKDFLELRVKTECPW